MTDENEIIISIGKLDYIFNNIKISFKELNKEINKFKKLVLVPEINSSEGKENFIPDRFFNEILKPLLEHNIIMNKKEILKECLIQRRYDSYNTLNRYLHILEINGFVNSEKIKNIKHYSLKKSNKKTPEV